MKTAYFAAALALVAGVMALEGVVFTLVSGPPTTSPPVKVNVEILIVGGERGDRYGFGFSEGAISSPGPDIRVKEGDVVKIVFKNVGALPHTFRITEKVEGNPPALFGASIGEPNRPLSPGEQGQTFFTADRAGAYFYICSVPGHAPFFGMFGRIIVEPRG